MKNLIVLLALVLLSFSCSSLKPNPLPSWNDNPNKDRIINFVKQATDEGNTNFIPVEDRIATFDNDGTLWVEKPIYIHVSAIFERYKELIAKDPNLTKKEPYKSIAKKEMLAFLK